jgi:hypothetical protein
MSKWLSYVKIGPVAYEELPLTLQSQRGDKVGHAYADLTFKDPTFDETPPQLFINAKNNST